MLSGCTAAVIASLGINSAARADPFYMGADVSLLTFMQQQHVVFKVDGVAEPGDQILYDAGDNLFRLRIFVNPQTTYNNTNVGAIQTQAYDIALAQQLKADDPNAKLLLDFHYSDTWADPGHQSIPAAWAGQTLSQLDSTIESYTDSTLNAFNAAGVMPNMVQVGNEINNGMLWPSGELNFSGTTAQQEASWQAFGSLINSAIAGVREAQGSGPKIQVAIHIANGDQDGEPQYFFGNLTNPSYGNVPLSSFDIMGVSYYPTATNDLSLLQTNLTAIANTYNKKIMVLEANAPWEATSTASDPAYPDTPAGQLQFLTDLRNTVMNLPNGDGEGVVYWYPESVQVPGYNIYNGGATALFDNNGNALAAIGAFNSTLPSGTWISPLGGNWSAASNWSSGVIPQHSGDNVNFGVDITTPSTVTLNANWTVGTVTFDNSNSYTISAGTMTPGSLILDNGGMSAVAAVTDSLGTHTISAPLVLDSTASFTVTKATDKLIVSGNITGAGGVAMSGSGTLLLSGINAYAGNTNINGGTLVVGSAAALPTATVLTIGQSNSTGQAQLAAGNGQSVISGLTINPGSTLDITNNSLLINYGAGNAPLLPAIQQAIITGYNGGSWTGSGIISSSAAGSAGQYAIGYADGSVDSSTAAQPGQVLIEYALAGDANLDGTVNLTDLLSLLNNYGRSGADWSQGDFNYDGTVNLTDLLGLLNNYGQSLTDARAVPEPACLGILSVGSIASLARRRARAPSRRLVANSNY